MLVKDKVGFGQFTKLKMEILEKIFKMHLAITQKVIIKYKSYKQFYTYIDATSGKGIAPDSNILGSLLVFLNSVHSSSFF